MTGAVRDDRGIGPVLGQMGTGIGYHRCMSEKVALVTGANRGLGFETCRQLAKKGFKVILTSRNQEKGEQATETLKKEGLDVTFHQLDVTDQSSIEAVKTFVDKSFGRLDVLINNAGIFRDKGGIASDENPSVLLGDVDAIQTTFDTNVYGVFRMCKTFVPLMQKNKFGRVVNVSSGMGQLSEMNGGYPGYRLSKTAVNALTRIFSEELKDANILVNSVCPGWVKTDMGGPNATRSIEEGVDTFVWLASLPDGGPSGKFFRDRKVIAW